MSKKETPLHSTFTILLFKWVMFSAFVGTVVLLGLAVLGVSILLTHIQFLTETNVVF